MGYQPYIRDLPDTDYAALQNANLEHGVSKALKRLTDIVIAGFALLFLLPIMVLIAVMVRLSDGGPVLFRHKRVGRDGEEFQCMKFRSMNPDAEAQLPNLLSDNPAALAEWRANQKIENDPRVTKFGKFLRKSSLDELPQLFNILRGEMSIVGPRPIVRDEIEKYGEFYAFYCQVRPGMTGLWQVSGRSDTSYQERVDLDVKYVCEWSFLKDLKIMAMTIPAVLFSDGAK